MDENNEEKKLKIFRPNNQTSLDTGKIQINEFGEYSVPDRRKMYKQAFENAKKTAVDAGLVSSSLISLEDIKGLSGRKPKENKQVKNTKSSKKRRK